LRRKPVAAGSSLAAVWRTDPDLPYQPHLITARFFNRQ
jgi:hypothetical protein